MTRACPAFGSAVIALLVIASAALPGCRSSESGSGAQAAVSATPPPRPVDHLAPGELLEGTDRAFGLALPRGLSVVEAFVSVVYAKGPLALHPVVQYLRARLEGGTLREGDTSATFADVGVRGSPGLKLTVHVEGSARSVSVELRDTTPKPAPDLPDEAARWKHVGLTPNGRLADPTHLE